jgi:hypothetical protein
VPPDLIDRYRPGPLDDGKPATAVTIVLRDVVVVVRLRLAVRCSSLLPWDFDLSPWKRHQWATPSLRFDLSLEEGGGGLSSARKARIFVLLGRKKNNESVLWYFGVLCNLVGG